MREAQVGPLCMCDSGCLLQQACCRPYTVWETMLKIPTSESCGMHDEAVCRRAAAAGSTKAGGKYPHAHCCRSATLTCVGQVGPVHMVEHHNNQKQRHHMPGDAGIELVQLNAVAATVRPRLWPYEHG